MCVGLGGHWEQKMSSSSVFPSLSPSFPLGNVSSVAAKKHTSRWKKTRPSSISRQDASGCGQETLSALSLLLTGRRAGSGTEMSLSLWWESAVCCSDHRPRWNRLPLQPLRGLHTVPGPGRPPSPREGHDRATVLTVGDCVSFSLQLGPHSVSATRTHTHTHTLRAERCAFVAVQAQIPWAPPAPWQPRR